MFNKMNKNEFDPIHRVNVNGHKLLDKKKCAFKPTAFSDETL